MTQHSVIAFTGLAGAGKSTAADALVDCGFVRVKFAGPLKAMLRAFYAECGVDGDTIERKIEGDLKEKPCPYLGGQTPRFAMQTLGTEWGRDLISPTLWVDAWGARVDAEGAAGNQVVCDDCRFDNESYAIHERDGLVVQIDREERDRAAGQHVSENLPDPDRKVRNLSPTPGHFAGQIAHIFAESDHEA